MELPFQLFVTFCFGVLAFVSGLPLELRPFAAIRSPDHFSCLNSSTLELRLELEISGIDVDETLDGSSICTSVFGGTVSGPKTVTQCTPITSRIPNFTDLLPGCHTVLAWWESFGGIERGSAHSVLFQVNRLLIRRSLSFDIWNKRISHMSVCVHSECI